MAFYNILSLFVTLSLGFLILHLRLTRKILNIPLDEENIINYYNYFLLLFTFSLCILVYLLLLHKVFKTNGKSYLQQVLKIWQKYNFFYHGYSLIFNYLGPGWTVYLVKFAKSFVEYSKYKLRIIMIIFVVLPRLFIISVLLWEIFILKNLHYYFYSLLVLFLPLFFGLFVFIFKDLSPRLLPEFTKFLDIDVNENDGSTLIGFKLKLEYFDMDMDDLMHNFYYPMVFLNSHMDVVFLPLYRKIQTNIILVYFICHALSWGYLLFT